jgi:diguanylate cyclase (GGDEF)-like protein
MRILVVEDDELVVQKLVKTLTDQQYVIDIAADGEAAWELVEIFSYDLILLDVMLPKLDGITLCRRLRSHDLKMPILLLTAQDDSTNKVIGLDAGADDYLSKPFNIQELLARIRALLRRGITPLPPRLEWGNLHLDPSSCEVTYHNQPLRLTPKEYALLELFLRNRQRVFSCNAILDQLWSFEEAPGEDTVRSHLKGLRQKLKAAGVTQDPIETVYGLGYRLKSLEEQQTKSKTKSKKREIITDYNPQSPSYNSDEEPQRLAVVNGVWARVKEKFSNRVAVIEQATSALKQNNLSEELRQQAQLEAHTLTGSLGIFGIDKGSNLAKEIEEFFQNKARLNQKQKQYLSELVIELREELQRAINKQSPDLQLVDEQRQELLIVGKEESLAQELLEKAQKSGLRGAIATEPSIAREWILSDRPDIVLLDLSFTDTTEDNLMLLAELAACTPPVPVLTLTAQDSLIDRLKIARLGGRGFLQKPVNATQVLEAVTQVLQRSYTKSSKVMIVDDDPHILNALSNLLKPWGLICTTLDNPLKFWETLETTAPDLLVLDVEMPNLSGLELCQVVRNDLRWSSLPILFLTAHTDAETMQQVFTVGADDYVSKPIVGPELVTRILNRIERSRLLKNLRQTDTLTGLANLRQSKLALNEFLQLAQHHSLPLCFVILKLNCLQQFNQQYGHEISDRVLSRLGELLRRTFCSEDVVARWGGAEFIVGMYGLTKSQGEERLSEVLTNLRQEKFTSGNGTQLEITFSAGVVQYPQDGTDLQTLYQAANAVLLEWDT